MPITLDVPDWGRVQALTLREAAKRLDANVADVQFWVDCDLFESYEWNTTDNRGKLKKTTIYIDLVDLAEAEKLAKQFPESAPWDRILWFRYEVRQRQLQEQAPARRQRPEPPAQKRRPPLPHELEDLDDEELLDELEARQPSRPPQAQRVQPRQAPSGQRKRQPPRQTIEDDDYYAEPDEPTVRDTAGSKHYPKKQLPAVKGKRGGWW